MVLVVGHFVTRGPASSWRGFIRWSFSYLRYLQFLRFCAVVKYVHRVQIIFVFQILFYLKWRTRVLVYLQVRVIIKSIFQKRHTNTDGRLSLSFNKMDRPKSIFVSPPKTQDRYAPGADISSTTFARSPVSCGVQYGIRVSEYPSFKVQINVCLIRSPWTPKKWK